MPPCSDGRSEPPKSARLTGQEKSFLTCHCYHQSPHHAAQHNDQHSLVAAAGAGIVIVGRGGCLGGSPRLHGGEGQEVGKGGSC